MTTAVTPPGAAPPSNPEPLYTYAQIARAACASERQVRRWVDESKLGYVQLPRGRRVTGRQYVEFVSSRVVEREA